MRSVLIAALTLMVGAATHDARAAEPPDQVRLSLERYEALMRAARANREGAQVTWSRGELRVTLPAEDASYLSASLSASVAVVGDGQAEVVLLPADVVIEAVSVNGSAATLTRRDGAHVVLLARGVTQASISVSYLVPARPGASGRSALVPLPALPGATLRVATGGREIDVWPGGGIQKQGNELIATLPSTVAAAIRFGDGTGGHQVRRTDYQMTVDPDGEGVDLLVTLDVHMTAGRARVRLAPASVALVDATEGDNALITHVRDGWHQATLEGTGQHTVVAKLRLAVDRTQGQPQIQLTLDKAPITRVEAVIGGKRTVTVEPSVPLTTDVTGEAGSEITKAHGFLPPSSSLLVRWTESRPAPEKLVRVNTEVYQLVSIQEGVIRSQVHVQYEILRGKVKELRIQIPDDAVLYKVVGEGIEDWRTFAPADGEPRRVQVTLGRETEGRYDLVLDLEKVVPKTEDADLTIPVVRTLGAFRETGVVALFDGRKVGFAEATATGYTTVGQDALPTSIRQGLELRLTQGFKHIGAPGAIVSKVTTVQPKEILYDARMTALYEVKEGAILAGATIDVEVKTGRSERLVLTFPEDVTILEATAPSVAKTGELPDFATEPGRKAYELRFTEAVGGNIEVTLEFELVPKDASGPVPLPDVRVHGAEVQEGSFGITAETGIEVTQSALDKLRRVDVSELPESVRRRGADGAEILLGYQYAHAPWSLDLAVKRHDTVQTLTAVVPAAWLETTVFEDGHVVTRAVFDVKNEDRQFVRLELPTDAKVWTVSADGQAVKAVRDETGAVAVPLRKGRTQRVEVVYEVRQTELRLFGSLAFQAPSADVLVTDLQWLIRMPKRFVMGGYETPMREGDAERYVGPGGTTSAPIAIPDADDVHLLLFSLPVSDPTEAAPAIGAFYIGKSKPRRERDRPAWAEDAPWGGTLAWGAAVVLLILVAFRRGRGRKLGLAGWTMLLIAIAAGAARFVGWGAIDTTEASFAVGMVVLAAGAGWLVARGNPRGEDAA